MPYLLIGVGLLVGLIGLYKFFVSATPRQVVAGVVVVMTGALALALFILAVTGRLPVALAALSALWPVGIALYNKGRAANAAQSTTTTKQMTRADALQILGLGENATDDDIHDAYKRLIVKVHPDQQGSEWMAAQLNAARDFLLKK